MRWDPYLLATGENVRPIWEGIASQSSGRTLFVVGRGFDPRMTVGVDTLLAAVSGTDPTVVVLDMQNDRDDPDNSNRIAAEVNYARLSKAVEGVCPLSQESIRLWEAHAGGWRRSGPERSRAFARSIPIADFSNVIVDISALPRGVFFPLVATLIKRIDDLGLAVNLHVFVAESAALDTRIVEEAPDEMGYFVPSFSAAMQVESEKPIIWFPLLAEGRRQQVELTQVTIEQVSDISEVCPVLPMPAADPRQPDKLIMEYHDFLLNRWNYDPRTLLYVAQQNPFQAYRLLVQTVRQYNKALNPLGGCRAVISAHSSKLMSMGALLAAYELKDEIDLGLANVDAGTHRIEPPMGEGEAVISTPFLVSLCGVAYDV